MKNTLRVLVGWGCNLHCAYCCNRQERFRSQFKTIPFSDIEWQRYPVVCISGGEPLLFPERVEKACRAAVGKLIVLYTNGTGLTQLMAQAWRKWGVRAVNVGVHGGDFAAASVVSNALTCFKGTGIALRFQAQDVHREYFEMVHPGVIFKFWRMDDCDRENETRVIVQEWSK